MVDRRGIHFGAVHHLFLEQKKLDAETAEDGGSL
jgi:hypothetical protein